MQRLMLHVAVADAMLRLDSLIYGMGWVIASSGATIHNHNQGGMLGAGVAERRRKAVLFMLVVSFYRFVMFDNILMT